MTSAKERLKKVADKLTEEDAGLVLILVRNLANRRRRLEEDREDLEAAIRAEVEMAATGKKPIPWEKVKAEAGL